MFNSNLGEIFLFHRQGVCMRPTTSLSTLDLRLIPYDTTQRTWYLFDPPEKKEIIQGPLFSEVNVFYAVFASQTFCGSNIWRRTMPIGGCYLLGTTMNFIICTYH